MLKFLKEYRGIFSLKKYDECIISKGCVEGENQFSLSNKVSIYKRWIFEGISRRFLIEKILEIFRIMNKKCVEGRNNQFSLSNEVSINKYKEYVEFLNEYRI